MALKDYLSSRFLRKDSNNRKYNPSMSGNTSVYSDRHLMELAFEIDWASLDSLFVDAGRLIIERDEVSIGMLKKAFHINSGRSVRVINQLRNAGILSGDFQGKGSEKEKWLILLSIEEFNKLLEYRNSDALVNNDTIVEEHKELERIEKEKAQLLSDEDYEYIDSFSNILVVKSTVDLRRVIVEAFCQHYPSVAVKTMICDITGMELEDFTYKYNMFVPVITDRQNTLKALSWVVSEIKSRQLRFIGANAKTIKQFNEKDGTGAPLFRIVIFLNGVEGLLRENAFLDDLQLVLMQGYKVGIHVVMLTNFPLAHIHIRQITRLFKVANGRSVSELEQAFDGLMLDADVLRMNDLFEEIIEEKSDEKMDESIENQYKINESTISIEEGEDESGFDLEELNGNQDKPNSVIAIIEDVEKMTGYEFEAFSKKLLEANGFTDVLVTKSSGDYGADIVAEKDDIKYVIQCKRYSGPVGESAVREVFTSKALYKAEIAVVLTNSSFTTQARILASHNFVHLWGADRFREMAERLL